MQLMVSVGEFQVPAFTPFFPATQSRLTYRRQGRSSVSNSESFDRRCSLGIQRVLCPVDIHLDINVNVQDPRAQIDRKLYKHHMQETSFNYPNLDVRTGSFLNLLLDITTPPPTVPPLVRTFNIMASDLIINYRLLQAFASGISNV